MDDSVIKVLRRNGAWNKVSQSSKNNSDGKENHGTEEADFMLDQKFGILAKEIKKRMKIKSSISSKNSSAEVTDKSQNETFENIEDEKTENIKAELLPYLLDIQKIANERSTLQSQIYELDDKLLEIRENINNMKKQYEKKLNNMKKNIDFFDNSLSLLDDIKGDRK